MSLLNRCRAQRHATRPCDHCSHAVATLHLDTKPLRPLRCTHARLLHLRHGAGGARRKAIRAAAPRLITRVHTSRAPRPAARLRCACGSPPPLFPPRTRVAHWRAAMWKTRPVWPADQNTSSTWPRLAEAGGRPGALDLALTGRVGGPNLPKPLGCCCFPHRCAAFPPERALRRTRAGRGGV